MCVFSFVIGTYFQVHSQAVTDISFFPSNNSSFSTDISSNNTSWLSNYSCKIATASADQTGKIVDFMRREPLCILRGHSGTVKSIQIQKNNPSIFA